MEHTLRIRWTAREYYGVGHISRSLSCGFPTDTLFLVDQSIRGPIGRLCSLLSDAAGHRGWSHFLCILSSERKGSLLFALHGNINRIFQLLLLPSNWNMRSQHSTLYSIDDSNETSESLHIISLDIAVA